MLKTGLAKILWLILIFTFLFSLPVIYFSYEIITPSGIGKDATFEVKEGESASEVICSLEENNLIRSSICFKIMARISGSEDKIKFGEYSIKRGMSSVEILKKITSGDTIMHPVTIPEGFTLNQIADLLESSCILDKEVFLKLARSNEFEISSGFIPKSLEGYLFPDSYFFAKNTAPQAVINKMIKRFQEKALPLFEDKKTFSANKLSFNQLIILASIIEAEARLDNERPLIASVYYNRLKEGWPLECDATVQYVLKERKVNLRYSDLEIDSPYNTYINIGLPPAPIGNPGIAAIKAALYPAKSDYFFYVRNDTKGDGSHIFTKTYSQHLEAIRKYQKY